MRLTTLTLSLFLIAAAPASGDGGKIVMTTSDYISGNTAAFDITAETLADNLIGHYQDAYVRTFEGKVYLIEAGSNSSIMELDMDAPGTPLWQYSVGTGSNPHDIVFVPGADHLKGYVLRYNKPALWVINLDTESSAGFKTGEIDLSAWNDADGAPEMHLGWYYGGYVWVVLQRYNLASYTAGTAVLVKIDPATDTVVDLDTATDGVQGRDLIHKNPTAGSLVDGVLYLAGTTYGATAEGVWAVDLTDSALTQRTVLPESTLAANVAGVYVASASYGVVTTYDASWYAAPRAFNPATGELIGSLPVPDAGGGMVLADGTLYVGSRHASNPALYAINPVTNTVTAGPFSTSLPPLTIAYAGSGSGSAAEEESPAPFRITGATPNPFNPSTTISFSLDRGTTISLAVHDVTGRKTAVLAEGFRAAGEYTIKWDARGYASGVYFIRLSDGARAVTTKVTLVK